MQRRTVLKLGATLGAVASLGLGGRYLLPPSPSDAPADIDELARRLVDSLDDETRRAACVDYDHPLRQYHNRGVPCGGAAVRPWTLSRPQRSLVVDLLHAGLSPTGRERIPSQFFVNWPGIHILDLLVCGDPRRPPYQIMLSGPHLNLRLGGASREGVAFGGPQVYGDQRGNESDGLPGNVYRHQFLMAHEIFRRLDDGRRRAALLPQEPIQTAVEVRGRSGDFDGLPVADLPAEDRLRVGALVDDILSTYADAPYARQCIEANGGLQALHVAWYETGEEGPAGAPGAPQIFRIEGPAAVFHFRGHPHVHAFINVAMDGEAPLSVGELLGHNPAALEGPAVKRLFEEALRHETGSDFGFYDLEAVAGRLRAGPVRTGDIYVLESWKDTVTVVGVRGPDLGTPFVSELAARGETPDPGRTYTIATTSFASGRRTAELGRPASATPRGVQLRDVTIDHLRTEGFPSVG